MYLHVLTPREKAAGVNSSDLRHMMAEPTGLEPATSDVTGRRSNQLNYHPARVAPGPLAGILVGGTGFEPVTAGV